MMKLAPAFFGGLRHAAVAVVLAGMLVRTSSGAPAAGPVNRSVVAVSACDANSLQNALNNAPDGAIVQIPAGTCDWGSGRVVLNRDKSIWLRGAGIGQTVIKRSAADDDSFALEFNCNQVRRVELSGFTFQGRHDAVFDGGVSLINGCRDFKIHDMRFTGYTASALQIRDTAGASAPYSRGVIYNSRFEDNFDPNDPASGEGYGVVVYGSYNDLDLVLGTEESVFIENNQFVANRHSIASNYGSRYVARYNTFVTTDVTRNTSMVDAHGRQSGSSRGSRSWEIYNNHLTYRGDDYWADGIAIRGGGGVVFGNTIDYDGDTEIGIAYTVQFVLESPDCPDYPGAGAAPPSLPGVTYPVADQVKGAWIWGNTHTWANGNATGYDEIRVTDRSSWDCRYYIKEGRDYFLFAKPLYQPFTYPHPLRGDSDVIFANSFN